MSGRWVDHSEAAVVGYTDRLSYAPGDTVTLCASAFSPDATMTLVRVSHDGEASVATPISEAVSVSIPHQSVALGSYGICEWELTAHSFAFAAWVLPSRLPSDRATILSTADEIDAQGVGAALSIDSSGKLHFTCLGEDLSLARSLRTNSWHFCVGGRSTDGQAFVALAPATPSEPGDRVQIAYGRTTFEPLRHGPIVTLGAMRQENGVMAHFDGRIEAARVLEGDITIAAITEMAGEHQAGQELNIPNMALAWWDGALNRGIFTLSDVVGGHDLQLINVPTRNVPGRWWSGDIHDPRLAPWQYAAVHFHSDDQDDQQWQPIAEVVLPEELESDVYGIQLMLASGNTDVVPFAVRRAPSKSRARIGVLLPTLTYLAYALEHAAPAGLVEHANETAAPFARANGFHSWYDLHEDGSFVTFCSLRRPLLGLRPDHRFRYTGAEHGLSADLRLLGWLRRQGFDYEVFTDHDLDERRAAALDGLACVVTGAHPEYWSARMLDGLEAYLQQGGNLCYLGGNGFVWSVVVDHSNGRAEMRRGDVEERPWDAQVGASHFQLTDGRSGLWQACGRPSARITGVTAAAMGFGPGVPFLATEGASDPSVSRLFDGIDLAQPLGTTSAVLGAGASYETDLANVSLGTPPNAIVIATAALPNGYVPFAPAFHRAASGEDGTSRLRADMVFFQTPAGGRVFAAGSIGWAGCLNADDEDSAAARLTTNLLQWFSEAS